MKNNGITLISIILTIVVLLIISGLSIKLIFNSDGLLNKALQSRETTSINSEIEEIQSAVLQTMHSNKTLEKLKDQLEQNLITTMGKNESELKKNGTGYLVKIIKTQRYYSINENGEVAFLGKVSDVEKDMENILLGNNLLDLTNLKNNTYISSNGSEVTYNGWASSDYIDVTNYKQLLIVSDNNTFIDRYNALYNENKDMLRIVNINKTHLTNKILGNVNISLAILNVKDNEKYLRVSQLSSIINHIKIYPILNENYNNILEFDINVDLLHEYNFGNDIFKNTKILHNTYISSSNGEETTYNSWDATDFIQVGSYNQIAIAYGSTNPINSYSAMYDSQKKYVSKLSVKTTTIDSEKGNLIILAIPSNVEYIRLSSVVGIFNDVKIFPIVANNSKSNSETYQNIEVENSILSNEQIIDNYYIGKDNGKEVSYNGWSETEYLDLSKYKSIIIVGNDNSFNAIYDENKKFIKTLNFSSSTLYNPQLGNIGAEIAYTNGINTFKYIRLSNKTSKLKDVRIYPVVNNDFNKHLIFNFSSND